MGAVSWLLRRNVSQSLACSDQPAAAEPVPAPLSLVNFPWQLLTARSHR